MPRARSRSPAARHDAGGPVLTGEGASWTAHEPASVRDERAIGRPCFPNGCWRSCGGRGPANGWRTVDGRRLRVLYPGRPAPGHGPDFRDALLELDGASLRGDVEVHRRPSEWRAHGHHQNPEYKGVVLHVVGGG